MTPNSTQQSTGILTVSYLNVGQGDSEFIEFPDGRTMLIFAWANSVISMPKSGAGIAARYALSQQKYLVRYLDDGRLEISNNRAERSIKPFVIDRKNFLFANTPRGAKASAVVFSLIETAKENGLNPFVYLTYVFRNAPNWDIRNNTDMMQSLTPGFIPDNHL